MGKSIKKDCRAVDVSFVKDFVDGDLKEILDFVKDRNNKMILLFRGNSGNIVTIYKRNHVFWEVTKMKNIKRAGYKFKIRFNFNHARFSECWKNWLDTLLLRGWEIEKKNNAKSVGYIVYKFDSITLDVLKEAYEIFNNAINDFFDKSKKYDWFKNSNKKNKGKLLEKERQQELFEKFDKPESGDGYVIYDLEFAEPGNKKGNQPDFFAVKYQNCKTMKLVVGEVKSKSSAFTGGSGLIEHIEKMKDYISRSAINNRKEEAKEILKRYSMLGLKGFDIKDIDKIDDFKVDDTVEILVVVTDEGIDEYNKNWKTKVESQFPEIEVMCI